MINILNNSNTSSIGSADTKSSQVMVETRQAKKVFEDKDSNFVIEHSLRPRKDGTVMEILNNCNVVLRNVFDNTTTVIRQLNDEDIENYRNEERHSAENYDKAIKESEKLSLERKAHQVRK